MQVPFEREHELCSTGVTSSATSPPPSGSDQSGNARPRKLVLPVVRQSQGRLQLIDPAQGQNLRHYLADDLDVSSLNRVHKHLWFAGLPQCARPLHHQLMVDRKITITERADLHLLWRDGRIYLKPLPDYLLNYDVWEGTLGAHGALSESARGFLLSYLWLVRQKSDFVIAQSENLLHDGLTWEQWTVFSAAIFPNVAKAGLEGVSPRYLYGELRLGRVNLIYRLCRKTRSSRTLVRGYFYGYHTYSSFVEKNFAWVLTVIVYITIVLTAMQVGLATTELQASTLFTRASYGFTVFSIVAPLGILLVALFVLVILITFNFIYAVKRRHAAWIDFPTVFNNKELEPH